jgi:7-cyano-7-deazaguanine synthase
MNHECRKAVVLLSGGLDSTTTLAIAQRDGFEVYALSFQYGQRHQAELNSARRVSERSKVAQHVVANIDLRTFGGSALTSDIAVPKGRSLDEMSGDIPVTYVPARNTVFLSFALAWAEVLGASDIFIGVNALDYSGYRAEVLTVLLQPSRHAPAGRRCCRFLRYRRGLRRTARRRCGDDRSY